MFELSIEREFSAAHAITINGVREPVHGHNWRVTAVVAGASLDADGLLVDFHVIERHMDRIIAPLNTADLNAVTPFDRVNPTAERVAEHIALELQKHIPRSVRLSYVRVTEAPGCAATYRPE